VSVLAFDTLVLYLATVFLPDKCFDSIVYRLLLFCLPLLSLCYKLYCNTTPRHTAADNP
jgi:hypothetical protein